MNITAHRLSPLLTLLLLLLVACSQPTAVPPLVISDTTAIIPTATSTTTTTPTQPPAPTATTISVATPSPTTVSTAAPTPFFSGTPSPACGQILPLFSGETAVPPTTQLQPDPNALAQLEKIIPASALPALRYLLDNPQDVGLAIYRLGEEANGVYLNADIPMPLASVVKLIHLVAYAEAVAAGQLNPLSTIPLAELDRYYLPRSDLGAHQDAVNELIANGRTFGDPPQILLDEVPWLMIRHSSNAATDYLHMLLGQTAIEETAVSLGLSQQTAPCPFLAQFLAMSNHVRTADNDRAALEAYLADPTLYGTESMLLFDAFTQDETFRADEISWRADNRRPSLPTQQFFTANLNAQGTARQYAALMARLAQNGLSNGDSSFIARRFLEWPMVFQVNQDLFDNLGYKNGRFPGLHTTVYYAYPDGQTIPIVIALFFHNLPNRTYQQWRSTLPHDEFARWLLYDPAALPALRAVINP
ncbi:MAG: serine hydrolase [Ardenticatenaceae bacterium]|nr:serine hydrolase [Ardenticatenaceae bacterium]